MKEQKIKMDITKDDVIDFLNNCSKDTLMFILQRCNIFEFKGDIKDVKHKLVKLDKL